MKTKIRISALLGILVLIILGITSCEKILDPVTKYYTIKVISDSNGIMTPDGEILVPEGSGKTYTYTLKPNPGYKRDAVSVNGINLPLTTDTTYNLSNINKDYEIKPIFVKDPSFPWDLVSKEWKYDSLVIRRVNGPWSHTALWGVSGNIQERVTFLPDGTFSRYWSDKFVGDGPWSINDKVTPHTLTWGELYIIEELDANNLVIARYNVPSLEDPDHLKFDFKYVYSHHN